jgi:hypothetical protein
MSDYDKMSDTELSAEVARRVMGSDYFVVHYGAGWYERDPRYWSPVTDGRHMLEVLGECVARGYLIHISIHPKWAQVTAIKGGSAKIGDAATLGRAVCLAALAAGEGK